MTSTFHTSLIHESVKLGNSSPCPYILMFEPPLTCVCHASATWMKLLCVHKVQAMHALGFYLLKEDVTYDLCPF